MSCVSRTTFLRDLSRIIEVPKVAFCAFETREVRSPGTTFAVLIVFTCYIRSMVPNKRLPLDVHYYVEGWIKLSGCMYIIAMIQATFPQHARLEPSANEIIFVVSKSDHNLKVVRFIHDTHCYFHG